MGKAKNKIGQKLKILATTLNLTEHEKLVKLRKEVAILKEGWFFLAVIIDLYSRQVVEYIIEEHMKTTMCLKALNMAYSKKKQSIGLFTSQRYK